MTLTFYGLKSCDSCRAALKALAEAGIETEVKDVRADGVPEDVLRKALDQHGEDRVVNRRSTTWRGCSTSKASWTRRWPSTRRLWASR